MHPIAHPDTPSTASWRCADAPRLGAALQEVRRGTLQVFDAYVAAGQLQVPHSDELNPPLWELGHIGWFQEFWIGRNPERDLGIRYNPDLLRLPSLLKGSDAYYNSSTVPHETRWDLSLPDAAHTKAYLAATLEQTLAFLSTTDITDEALYFYRLVLFHEAMHLEAAVYMAQALGVSVDNMLLTTHSIANNAYYSSTTAKICIKNLHWTLGWHGAGFAFDNELAAHPVALNDFKIDSQAVRWRPYLQFVQATDRALPRYVRKTPQGYEHQHDGVWQALDMQAAAVHLSWHDAQAYCVWAGRRLPTEAEWECAALTSNMVWGEVWEWTSSTFEAFPGFVAHPYRDYSAPWFGSRPVLKGACTATQASMRHPKYRNYFMADRTDIFAGFRTCAL